MYTLITFYADVHLDIMQYVSSTLAVAVTETEKLITSHAVLRERASEKVEASCKLNKRNAKVLQKVVFVGSKRVG